LSGEKIRRRHVNFFQASKIVFAVTIPSQSNAQIRPPLAAISDQSFPFQSVDVRGVRISKLGARLSLKPLALYCSLLLSLVGFARAQDAPLPQPEKRGPGATASPADAKFPLVTPPPQLIPPDVLPLPKGFPTEAPTSLPNLPELDKAFSPPPAGPLAAEQQRHLEWRRLQNQVQNDPALKAALKRAEAARTDLEKRKLLGAYYDLFYDKLSARAGPEMKDYLVQQKLQALRSLPQPRVRPELSVSSSLVDPTGSPSPSPASSPSPVAEPLGSPDLPTPGESGN